MNRKFKKIYFLLIFSATLSIQAQQVCRLRIEGTVLLGKDSLPASMAEIFVEQGRIKTTSDADGKYLINGICPGKITLEIDIKDYGHFHIESQISKDTQLVIILPVSFVQLKETTVKSHADHEAIELTDKEIILTAGSNLSEVLGKLNGLTTLRSGTSVGKPMVNGFTGMRVPVFVNGVKQAGQQWGNDHGPDASSMGFDEIKLIQGVEVLTQTADAFGGIIVLNNNKSEVHNGETDIKAGTGFGSNGRQWFAFGRMHQRPYNGKFIWYSNVYSSMRGNVETPGHTLSNTGLREVALNMGGSYKSKKRQHNIDFSYYTIENGIYSGTRTGSIADILQKISQEQSYQDVGFTYKITPTRQTVNHLQASYVTKKQVAYGENFGRISIQSNNRREYDFHRSRINTFPQMDLSLLSSTLELGRNREYKNLINKYGVQSNFGHGVYGGYYFIPDFNYFSQSAYTLLSVLKSYKHSFALRGEYHYLKSSANITPKLNDTKQFPVVSGGYEIEKKKRHSILKYNVMLMGRIPWVNELYSAGVHHGASSYEQGQHSLKPEKNITQAIQIEFKNRRSYFFGRIYGHYIKDFINLQPDASPIQTVRGVFPSYTYKQFDAIYSGIDFTYDLHIDDDWRFLSKGSFTYGRDIENNKYPAFIPPIKVSGMLVHEGKAIESNIEYVHTFHQSFYTANTDIQPPPPGYGIINVLFTVKQPRIARWFHFSAGATNLMNIKYKDYIDRFRYYSYGQGINIFFKITINAHKHKEH